MTRKLQALVLCLGLMVWTNCSKDPLPETTETNAYTMPAPNAPGPGLVAQLDQIVILYDDNPAINPSTLALLKDAFYTYLANGNPGNPANGIPPIQPTVFSVVRPPSCMGSFLEKLEIDSGSPVEIIIEHLKKKPVLTDEDEELEEFFSILKEIDRNFLFQMDPGNGSPINPVDEPNPYPPYLSNNPAAVKIGVLDSGFTPSHLLFGNSGAFLYDSSQNPCTSVSGWDFVSSEDAPLDENQRIHGTLITYLIHEELKEASLPYQIIPARVANEAGSIEYFNLMKGLEYLLNEGVSVVNMSFGWYNNRENINIMAHYITDYEHTYFICSAGNFASDVDESDPHYPSGFENKNILAVTAINEDGDSFVSKDPAINFFANYGSDAVDLAAHGVDVPIYDSEGHKIFLPSSNAQYIVNGTSFAAPLVSAMVAKMLWYSGDTVPPSQFKAMLFQPGSVLQYGIEATHITPDVEAFVPTHYNLHLKSIFGL